MPARHGCLPPVLQSSGARSGPVQPTWASPVTSSSRPSLACSAQGTGEDFVAAREGDGHRKSARTRSRGREASFAPWRPGLRQLGREARARPGGKNRCSLSGTGELLRNATSSGTLLRVRSRPARRARPLPIRPPPTKVRRSRRGGAVGPHRLKAARRSPARSAGCAHFATDSCPAGSRLLESTSCATPSSALGHEACSLPRTQTATRTRRSSSSGIRGMSIRRERRCVAPGSPFPKCSTRTRCC